MRKLYIAVLILCALAALFLLVRKAHAAPTAHQVTLTWAIGTQPTGTTVTGQNVYRSQTSGGPYTQIASINSTTTYTDSTVTSGQTYYYVLTNVAGSEESAYSAQVQAIVPTSPNPPTGITVAVQ
jgi:fibronectin type 3 domain-containing protein